jgi:hypothetical protein
MRHRSFWLDFGGESSSAGARQPHHTVRPDTSQSRAGEFAAIHPLRAGLLSSDLLDPSRHAKKAVDSQGLRRKSGSPKYW